MLKKRVFIIFILIVCLYFFLNRIYAINKATVYLSSTQDLVEKGEEIEISVNMENMKTAAFDFSLYFEPSKLEYVSDEELVNVNVMENRILLVWFDDKGGEGAKEGKLATFKFRAKENGLATFVVEGNFYTSDGQLIQTDFQEKQIQIGKEEKKILKNNGQSDNANLQSLRLDQEGLIPSFDKSIYDYYLTIPNEIHDIEVLAMGENPNAKIEISGNQNLQEGLNDITVRVISEDGSKDKVYTIQVSKTQNLELANTNLEILAIENALLYPPFDVLETNYKTEISNEQEAINILAVPEKEEAIVEIIGEKNLKEGKNLITVMVTAPNGFTKRKYEVEVYRRSLVEEKNYQEEQQRRNRSVRRSV